MMIDKVGGVGPNYGPRKTGPVERKDKPSQAADNVSISDEAARAALAAKTARLASTAEDQSRVEKLRQVKERLDAGEYDNLTDEQLDKIADRLADSFLGRS